MTRILIDGAEIDVSEQLDEVMARLVAAKDGIRRPDGSITAPSGWMTLSEAMSGESIYLQTDRLGYIRED
jgi:hypothetical protein